MCYYTNEGEESTMYIVMSKVLCHNHFRTVVDLRINSESEYLS